MQWRNPTRNADGTIDIEINHPRYGWIPFTADPADTGAGFDVAALVAAIEAAGPVPDAPPIPAQQTTQITFAQLVIGLVAADWITEAEGDGWITGTLPPPVLALIAQRPAGQRFAARALALRPDVVRRSDQLITALGAALGKSSTQIDAFFNTYGAA
jgi:hypothetical protein